MNAFPKIEKLCGQLRIAAVYKEGKRLTAFPMRVTVKTIPCDTPAAPEVLIWAPKSIFKHAVDRNHMRRLMREAYRLEKEPLLRWSNEQKLQVQIAFNYFDKEQRSLPELRKAMAKAIKKITIE